MEIQSEAVTEQRFFAVDVLHGDVLELQGIDDQFLEFPFQVRHIQAFPA